MKITGLLIAIILNVLIVDNVHPQSLKFRAACSYDFHLKKYHHGLYGIDEEMPSIATYYDDNNGLNLDLSFRFGSKSIPKGHVFLGMMYEYAVLNSNSVYTGKSIFGKNLIQKKYTPYLGAGGYLDKEKYQWFPYLFVGVTFNDYKSEENFLIGQEDQSDNVDVVYKFKRSLSFRFGGGMDLENIGNYPLTLGLSVYVDAGKSTQNKVDLLLNGDKIAGYESLVGNTLYDNTIYAALSLAYQINF